ncbi:hypothetical protein BDA96_09G071500 [Sorghum bicolor]|uniref:Uncharacterized protein n=1 Tax=Sorghum bicolor TaxID=4558 RepID=A0A921QAI2_SORBI|nr:hypothetical protein BDA96_09G071500 [Sorghum bicolor]
MAQGAYNDDNCKISKLVLPLKILCLRQIMRVSGCRVPSRRWLPAAILQILALHLQVCANLEKMREDGEGGTGGELSHVGRGRWSR